MTRRIKVTLLMALTVDGMIARGPQHFTDWTEREDKLFFKELSQKAGAVIMGSKTFDTIGKPLPRRKNIVLTRRDRRSDNQNLIFTADPPHAILNALENEGFDQVILAGGATINTLFAKDDLVDEIIITVSSQVFGTGISLFSAPVHMNLRLDDMQRLGQNSVLLTYRVNRSMTVKAYVEN